ncbi:secreted RxLR effector protein 161-like [Humulus lupulus]|uniref:secreted RxLR effector protein 161-like n=1 Tax=Humulus lupulus TaxID=3486 RepID=UPI002B4030A1|nr:secreted RxLR effector protein 161-like [Humulus lupulus]
MAKVPYSNVVGAIMYLIICTRPDLSHSISALSRYMENPGRIHWNAMKWLLRYLINTTRHGLVYKRHHNQVEISGFVDSDYVGDRDTRKSTTTYYFLVSGNCVSWKSQLQSVVALSTTEAEYMAATEAIKEGIWVQGLLKELQVFKGKATIFLDSQSAIHLCKNPVFHDRTKHVEIKYHFIRDKVIEGVINVEKVPTEENPADVGTKILPLSKFNYYLSLLGIDHG